MKLTVIAILFGLSGAWCAEQLFPNEIGTPRHIGKRTIRPKPGWIWVTFEESGHKWMVGARKEEASSSNDPGLMKTDFDSDYSIRVQEVMGTQLFHNCCTTNIQILTNYTGTIQIGTNFLKLQDLRAP